MNEKKIHTLNINGRLYLLDGVKIMGILNVSPESFFDGGRYKTSDEIKKRIDIMVEQGADIIDVGGQSTKPGSKIIDIEEEINRVSLAIKYLKKQYPGTIVSIDTFKADVAEFAVNQGADIINDISSGQLDQDMFKRVASLKVPYIAMHSRGTPETMQNLANYDHITNDVINFFAIKINELMSFGVKDVIIDPGFGFAKNLDQNYELMRNIQYLQIMNRPVLVGISRKSMIYKALGIDSENSLNGTTVLHTHAISKGIQILRVHDVKEAKEAVTLMKLLNH